jgi:hypothetical protein
MFRKEVAARPILRNGASDVKIGPGVPEILVVTPEIAQGWLSTQVRNRSLIEHKVNQYASDMVAGRWHLSDSAICFDKSGALINGQHRLHACIRSGVSFTTLVMRGMEADAQFFMDLGSRRSLKHALELEGESGTKAKAAMTRMIAVLCGHNEDWTAPFGRKVYELNKEGIELICIAMGTGQRKLSRAAVTGSLAFCYRRTPETVLYFAERLRIGAGLSEGDPAFVVREYLLADKLQASRRVGELDSKTLAPLIVHAVWHAHNGHKLYRVAWPKTNSSLEFFRAAHPEY